MSKYVNVDAFVEALCKTLSTLRKQKDNTPESIAFLKGAQVVAKELMKFPAADVTEVRYERWEEHGCKWQGTDCKVLMKLDGTPQENSIYYCPNCGAKIDEEETNELD